MASPGWRQLASRSMCGSRRPAATRETQAVEHPGRAAALGQLGEDEQAVDARSGRAAEQRAGGVLDVRARVAVGEGDDGAVGRDALDRGAQRRAADALDDHVELGPLGRELVDDLVGAEVGEAAGALGAGRDGGHVGAADVGELHGEAPDAAARAGDEHAPRDRVAADVEGQQGGDPGDGERRGLREAHLVGQDRHRVRRHGGELRPRLVVEGDDAGSLGRAAAVGGRAAHRPGEVPAGEAARRLVGQRLDLAAVERDGLDGDEGLAGQRLGVGRLGQLDARICGGSQQGEHAAGPYRSGFACPRCENRRHGPARPPGPGGLCLRRAPARVRGRVALAAGGALVAAAARAARGGLRTAHAAAARPRPDRALQGLPAPQAQDAGLRRARGRPLPHAPDPHARGHPDLAHRRARPAPQRGPDRGHRAGPRPRPSGLRAHRRGRARRLPARALRHAAFATTSTPCASSTCSSSTARG